MGLYANFGSMHSLMILSRCMLTRKQKENHSSRHYRLPFLRDKVYRFVRCFIQYADIGFITICGWTNQNVVFINFDKPFIFNPHRISKLQGNPIIMIDHATFLYRGSSFPKSLHNGICPQGPAHPTNAHEPLES